LKEPICSCEMMQESVFSTPSHSFSGREQTAIESVNVLNRMSRMKASCRVAISVVKPAPTGQSRGEIVQPAACEENRLSEHAVLSRGVKRPVK